MSPKSTLQRIFNQHNQGARILNGEKYVEEGAWWDYRGIRDHGKMDSEPTQEMIIDERMMKGSKQRQDS